MVLAEILDAGPESANGDGNPVWLGPADPNWPGDILVAYWEFRMAEHNLSVY